ncbi:hypothetical protein DRN58_00740 [Thermococci archaeon]|nr:MAG: hypothetical protein DRN58_00740 [Thermococci archaeon]
MKKILDKLGAKILRDESRGEYSLIEFSLNEIYYSRVKMLIYPNKIILESPVVYIENPNASKELFSKYKSNFEEVKTGREYKYKKTLPKDTHQLRGYIKKLVRSSCIVGLNYELRYYRKYKAREAAKLLEKYGYPIEFD